MYYKSKFLMGFSLAFLFVSVSLPVVAMEEGEQNEELKKKNVRYKRLVHSVRAARARRDSQNKKASKHKDQDKKASKRKKVNPQKKHPEEVFTPNERKNVVKLKSVQLKTDSIEILRKLKEQNQISKNDVECLTNQEQHLHILGEAITQSAEQKVEIYSPFVSKSFIKNTLMPWVNSSEKPLHVFIYSTTLGLKKLEKVVGCEEPRFDEQHTLSVARCDSPSNVLIAGDLAVLTSYPLLTFPHEDRKSDLFVGTVFRKSYAQPIIEKIREQLEIAAKKSPDDLKDGSLAGSLVAELNESIDSDYSSPYPERKHNNSGGSFRGGREVDEINYREGSGSLSGASDSLSGGSDDSYEKSEKNKKRDTLNGSGTFGRKPDKKQEKPADVDNSNSSSGENSSPTSGKRDNTEGSDYENDEIFVFESDEKSFEEPEEFSSIWNERGTTDHKKIN